MKKVCLKGESGPNDRLNPRESESVKDEQVDGLHEREGRLISTGAD